MKPYTIISVPGKPRRPKPARCKPGGCGNGSPRRLIEAGVKALNLAPLRGVEFVIVVKSFPQEAFDQDGLGENISEAHGLVAQSGFNFGEDLRCASGGVDALHLGVEKRGCDCDAIVVFECGFLRKSCQTRFSKVAAGSTCSKGGFSPSR